MKIEVVDLSNNGEVFVSGLYGPKTIAHLLDVINEDIKNVNISLRSLYE